MNCMEISGKTLGLLQSLQDRLQDRLDGVPSEVKVLPRYLSDGTEVKTVQDVQVALNVDEFVANLYVKSAGHVPPKGVQAAGKRAQELIKAGRAGGGFTSTGRTRASQLANGASLSEATIRRMHSYFSRHAVDKKPGWSDAGKETPGYVAWQAWGGDAGAAWARGMVRSFDAGTKSLQNSTLGYPYKDVDPTQPHVPKGPGPDSDFFDGCEVCGSGGWDGAIHGVEEKAIRRVRTAQGALNYGQPIGSIISRDRIPGGVVFPGYAKVPDKPRELVDSSGSLADIDNFRGNPLDPRNVKPVVPKPASVAGSPAAIFANPFHGEDVIDPDTYRGVRTNTPEDPNATVPLFGAATPAPTSASTGKPTTAASRPRPSDVVGTRRVRSTDLKPANPADISSGRAPAANDPWLRASNDAYAESIKAGLLPEDLEGLNRIRENIRNGDSFVGGELVSRTLRDLRVLVPEGSKADRALIELNDQLQGSGSNRVWNRIAPNAVVSTPVVRRKRDTKGRAIALAKEKASKDAMDLQFTKTRNEFIRNAKALKADPSDSVLQRKMKQSQDDLDKARQEYAKKRWPIPVMPIRKKGEKREDAFLLIMSNNQRTAYEALPTDARAMYLQSRRQLGADHVSAIQMATENQPRRAKVMTLGRKLRAGFKVNTNDQSGDDYMLRKDASGYWHATYDSDGTAVEIGPARFKDEKYALAALEEWHDEFYRALNAGKTRPIIPNDTLRPLIQGSNKRRQAGMQIDKLGNRRSDGGIDYYSVEMSRAEGKPLPEKYFLNYDGVGWYTTRVEKDGSESEVTGTYFADGEAALRAMHASLVESRRRTPGSVPLGGVTKPVVAQYAKIDGTKVKSGDLIATLDNRDGSPRLPKQAELAKVYYRTVSEVRIFRGGINGARFRERRIYFTDGTYVVPGATPVYRRSKGLGGTKDISSASVSGGGSAINFGSRPMVGPTAHAPRHQRPLRRRRSAWDRANAIVKKKALRDFAEFVDEMKVRRVRTAGGARRFGQPVGSIIRLDAAGNPITPLSDGTNKPGPMNDSGLGRPKKVDGWTIYNIDVLGNKFGITADDEGWYSYYPEDDSDTDGEYYATPQDALAALTKFVATTKPKKATKPVAKKPATKAKADRTPWKPSALKPPTPTYGGKPFRSVFSNEEGGQVQYYIEEHRKGSFRVFSGLKGRPATDGKTYKSVADAVEGVKAFHARRDNTDDIIHQNKKPTKLREGFHWASPKERLEFKVSPGWRHAQVSDDPANDYVLAQGIDSIGRPQTITSDAGVQAREDKKWDRLDRFMPKLPALDKALAADAVNDPIAAAVLVMRIMGMRVGGPKDVEDDDSKGSVLHTAYGTTTLMWNHRKGVKDTSVVEIDNDKKRVRFQFTGKEGVMNDLSSDDAGLYAAMSKLEKQKGKNAGRVFPSFVTSDATGGYIKQKTGISDAENRTLRTVLATSLAAELVGAKPRTFATENAMKKAKLEIAAIVSDALGNKPQQALTSYIDPRVFALWSLNE